VILRTLILAAIALLAWTATAAAQTPPSPRSQVENCMNRGCRRSDLLARSVTGFSNLSRMAEAQRSSQPCGRDHGCD
jgi:hypothetical protein